MQFYHVTRTENFEADVMDRHAIDYEHWYVHDLGKFSKTEYIAHLQGLFPNGVTKHGERYMLPYWPSAKDQNGLEYVSNIAVMETIFEMVRRFKFPDAISRFEAVFGCRSIDDAKQIRQTVFNGHGKIYKVECNNFIEADMNLLFSGHSFGASNIYAEKYWSGQKSENPFIEILMHPPVTVIGVIE